MALTASTPFSEMLVEPVKKEVLLEALEEVALTAIAAKLAIEKDEPFFVVPSLISTLDLHLSGVKSGLSVMVLHQVAGELPTVHQEEPGGR